MCLSDEEPQGVQSGSENGGGDGGGYEGRTVGGLAHQRSLIFTPDEERR